jgi:hypothetical protein
MPPVPVAPPPPLPVVDMPPDPVLVLSPPEPPGAAAPPVPTPLPPLAVPGPVAPPLPNEGTKPPAVPGAPPLAIGVEVVGLQAPRATTEKATAQREVDFMAGSYRGFRLASGGFFHRPPAAERRVLIPRANCVRLPRP